LEGLRSVAIGRNGQRRSAGFAFELVDESDDELHHFALLFAWEFPDFLERPLDFTDWAGAIGEGLAGAADVLGAGSCPDPLRVT